MPILGSIIKQVITVSGKIPVRRSTYKQQVRELRKLMLKAQFTEFGKKYEFNELILLQDPIKIFQNTVPLHDYQSIFDAWWHRTLKGEKDICWPGKIKYFALSSGTAESSSKHIPVTKNLLKAIHKGTIKQILSTKHLNLSKEQYETEILFVGGSTNLSYNVTISGANALSASISSTTNILCCLDPALHH